MRSPASAEHMAVARRCCQRLSMRRWFELPPPAAAVQPPAVLLHTAPTVLAHARARARARARTHAHACERARVRVRTRARRSMCPCVGGPEIIALCGRVCSCRSRGPCQRCRATRVQDARGEHPRPVALLWAPPCRASLESPRVWSSGARSTCGRCPSGGCPDGAPEPQEPAAGAASAEAPRRFHGLGTGSRVLAGAP